MRFTICYSRAGFGLVKDAKILQEALHFLGHEADIVEVPIPGKGLFDRFFVNFLQFLRRLGVLFFYRKLQRMLLGKPTAVTIYLEKIFYEKLFLHRYHVLVPNQEWFNPKHFELLNYIDNVWVKTLLAKSIFQEFKLNVSYIGFCSQVEIPAVASKTNGYFFSRVGVSRFRGADVLVDTWRNHPEWPLLKIVIDPSCRPENPPVNVEYLDTFSNYKDYVTCASAALFHVYPTEVEGFGHSIVEAMGYGAIVLVTDAPPMNEIANADCALLIAANYSGQKLFSPRFSVNPLTLAHTVNAALQLSSVQIQQLSDNALRRPSELKDSFYSKLEQVIKTL